MADSPAEGLITFIQLVRRDKAIGLFYTVRTDKLLQILLHVSGLLASLVRPCDVEDVVTAEHKSRG